MLGGGGVPKQWIFSLMMAYRKLPSCPLLAEWHFIPVWSHLISATMRTSLSQWKWSSGEIKQSPARLSLPSKLLHISEGEPGPLWSGISKGPRSSVPMNFRSMTANKHPLTVRQGPMDIIKGPLTVRKWPLSVRRQCVTKPLTAKQQPLNARGCPWMQRWNLSQASQACLYKVFGAGVNFILKYAKNFANLSFFA